MKIPYTHKIVKTYADGEKMIGQARQIRYLFGLVRINHRVEVRTENTFKTLIDVYLLGIKDYSTTFRSKYAYPFYVGDVSYDWDIFNTKDYNQHDKNH